MGSDKNSTTSLKDATPIEDNPKHQDFEKLTLHSERRRKRGQQRLYTFDKSMGSGSRPTISQKDITPIKDNLRHPGFEKLTQLSDRSSKKLQSQMEALAKSMFKLWNPLIFERDKHQCVVCGSKEKLNCAHITSIGSFYNELYCNGRISDPREAIRLSFSYDNLITLCSGCHFCYSKRRGTKRGRLVKDLFEAKKKERGWINPEHKLLMTMKEKGVISEEQYQNYCKKYANYRVL